MSSSLAQLQKQAFQLTAQERAEFAQSLLESLRSPSPVEVEAAWDAEIDRRIAAHDNGQGKSMPSEEVHARIKHLLKR